MTRPPHARRLIVTPRPAVICGWCKTQIRPGDGPVSHGVCDVCVVERLHRARVLGEPSSD